MSHYLNSVFGRHCLSDRKLSYTVLYVGVQSNKWCCDPSVCLSSQLQIITTLACTNYILSGDKGTHINSIPRVITWKCNDCKSHQWPVTVAGIVRVWVAGKTVWSPCYTHAISECFREWHNKALYKFTYFTFYFTFVCISDMLPVIIMTSPCYNCTYLYPMKRKTRDSQQRIKLMNMMGQHMINHEVKSTSLFGLYSLHTTNSIIISMCLICTEE